VLRGILLVATTMMALTMTSEDQQGAPTDMEATTVILQARNIRPRDGLQRTNNRHFTIRGSPSRSLRFTPYKSRNFLVLYPSCIPSSFSLRFILSIVWLIMLSILYPSPAMISVYLEQHSVDSRRMIRALGFHLSII
jgi:hypothetical protein